MTKSPAFWAAGLACAVGGAMAGSALGSTPILDRPTLTEFYTTHDDAERLSAAREPLPDHYPLVTRAGTVPVAELGQRGLYSQARYRATYAAFDESDRGYVDDPGSPPAEMDSAPGPALAVSVALDRGDAASESAAPLQLAAPVEVAQQSGAKLIDVAATLAMR